MDDVRVSWCLTATVWEIFGGQTNISILVLQIYGTCVYLHVGLCIFRRMSTSSMHTRLTAFVRHVHEWPFVSRMYMCIAYVCIACTGMTFTPVHVAISFFALLYVLHAYFKSNLKSLFKININVCQWVATPREKLINYISFRTPPSLLKCFVQRGTWPTQT